MKAMKITIKSGLLAVAVATMALSAGCDKKFSTPEPYTPEVLTDNVISIADLLAMYSGGSTTIRQDVNVVGKVVSSDQAGNIYTSLYIQDQTAGLQIKLGRSSLFNLYPVGMTVSVRANGLTLGAYGTMVSLGAGQSTSVSSTTGQPRTYENSNIAPDMWIRSVMVRGPIEPLTAADTTVITSKAQMTANKGYLCRLVRIVGTFYMNPADTTWADVAGNTYGSHYVNFAGSPANTTTDVTIRTSNYATFANRSVKALNGKPVTATGILTVFQSGSTTTYQLVLNTDADVVPTN